jgi:hypothetical protein
MLRLILAYARIPISHPLREKIRDPSHGAIEFFVSAFMPPVVSGVPRAAAELDISLRYRLALDPKKAGGDSKCNL